MATTAVHEPPPRYAIRDAALQKQLMARQSRLRGALPSTRNREQLQDLLHEVDAALERMEAGTFGICETCHDTVESDRLLFDPLCRNCLDHLSAAEQRALERDLDLAFQVQSGLLPKPGLAAKGWSMAYHYRPAGPVSGDFCDLVRLDEETSLFLLGDVMGKGVAASMLTAHLHAIFRSLSTPTASVSELVAKANRVFCDGTVASFFATLVCGRLGRDGHVEICNAGHCPPLHFQDGTVVQLESSGLPLGLFRDAEYTSYDRKLSPGHGVVIHSDGLSEAFNNEGAQYGIDRLSKLLQRQRTEPADQVLASLLDDLGDFRSNAPVTDDLTVMVVRRES